MADDPLILHLLDAVNESATDINRNYSFAFLRLHCLLEMEQVLISVEKESGLDLLDETRKLVDRTLHTLKAQIDDVEQMKGFFQ
uniref:Uncharacterized protein n=1 Tax=Romanomermis culicivorax TaxID=13658 RepID=A0A915HG40_ROMCU